MKKLAFLAGLSAVMTASSYADLKLTQVVSGLSLPIAAIADPVVPNTQYVIQQRGLIRVVQNGAILATSALNLTGIVSTSGSERGLLGMTFHPNYPKQPYIYLNYTVQNASHATRIVRYTRSAGNPHVFDAASAQTIIQIAQPFNNHNGGTLAFGPDGYLYIGMGDGGSQGDPNNNGQSLTSLLGKMLRIDPSDTPGVGGYTIPAGQPIAVTGGTLANEVFLFGLRNPWKWSFDDPTKLGTGALVIGDVGWDTWEEINYVPAGQGGRNFGWRSREGFVSTGLSGGPNTQYRDPIHVYDHGIGVSITGGHVYRGTKLGDIFGRYFFADFSSNLVWSALIPVNPTTGEASTIPGANITEHTTDLQVNTSGISSIDVDRDGELYLLDYGLGRLYRIDPENQFWPTDLALVQGTFGAGELRSTLSDDDKYLEIISDYLEDTIFGEGGVAKLGFTRDAIASTFSLSVTAKSNQNSTLPVQFLMRNWVTGRVERIPTSSIYNLGTTESTVTINGISGSNYMRTSDRRVELYISVNQGIDVDPAIVYVDKVKLQ